ncbi:hypothetical protein VCSRO127_0491 [Vibrio cholerae]|nr:hypothetical protein VCSRO127_0491 [Vibrio cholerae]
MKNIIIKNIHEHLVSCGFSAQNSITQAGKAWQFFQKQICNSRDPYKDACDHAGGARGNCRAESQIQITKGQVKASHKETSGSIQLWGCA